MSGKQLLLPTGMMANLVAKSGDNKVNGGTTNGGGDNGGNSGGDNGGGDNLGQN